METYMSSQRNSGEHSQNVYQNGKYLKNKFTEYNEKFVLYVLCQGDRNFSKNLEEISENSRPQIGDKEHDLI
jgi:hypothetical protein